ncbi:MAG: hypothetical protein ACPGSD_17205 [Flavobacteriales bacterium]
MKSHVEESKGFNELMYMFPQSPLSRKYKFICITPDMLRTGVNFDKFCKEIGKGGIQMSTKLSANNVKDNLMEYSEIKIDFDHTSYFAYQQNPNIQIDFIYFLMQTLKAEYLDEVPWGQKRKIYFNN